MTAKNNQLAEKPDEVHAAEHTIKDCDCAEKIRALEEQIDLLESQLAALKAEVIETIKPFSAEYSAGYEDDYIILCADVYEPICTVGELRRLAALCEKLEGK